MTNKWQSLTRLDFVLFFQVDVVSYILLYYGWSLLLSKLSTLNVIFQVWAISLMSIFYIVCYKATMFLRLPLTSTIIDSLTTSPTWALNIWSKSSTIVRCWACTLTLKNMNFLSIQVSLAKSTTYLLNVHEIFT